ncbi:uncharacterized protein K489DRAFT_382710 [Dissoconium aciculare CBS 342.82]|uniref:Uncharacterized protein n=1 Tax=Dissoconium aciculare CBS 342.82 TaxID=1314786 RepID=A0A6J3LYD2_9PEZI|nr:uncharacterized protein K489DRAFT_382710 [Dissoconium aciculare CBS 342.82]KAF1820775.1 hypothetical protein K489DRAFT_382710 [Dissoconium aciculare CBS 342.82]
MTLLQYKIQGGQRSTYNYCSISTTTQYGTSTGRLVVGSMIECAVYCSDRHAAAAAAAAPSARPKNRARRSDGREYPPPHSFVRPSSVPALSSATMREEREREPHDATRETERERERVHHHRSTNVFLGPVVHAALIISGKESPGRSLDRARGHTLFMYVPRGPQARARLRHLTA